MEKNKIIGSLMGTVAGAVLAGAIWMTYAFGAYTHSSFFDKKYIETIKGKVIGKEYRLTHGNEGGSLHSNLGKIVIQSFDGEERRITIPNGNNYADERIHKVDLIEFRFIYKDPVRIWSPFGMITEYTEENGKSFVDWDWNKIIGN